MKTDIIKNWIVLFTLVIVVSSWGSMQYPEKQKTITTEQQLIESLERTIKQLEKIKSNIKKGNRK